MNLIKKMSGKASLVAPYNYSTEKLAPPGYMHNPFGSKLDKGYDSYVDNLENGELKNNS
jgi:hypothetical protein